MDLPIAFVGPGVWNHPERHQRPFHPEDVDDSTEKDSTG
jgi:hypothetical protein